MADLISFFIHRDSYEIAIGNPTSFDETAKIYNLKYRGHHADWFKGLWRRGCELVIEGETPAMRASVLNRFPTRAALIAHAKMLADDEEQWIITTQAEADEVRHVQPDQRLIVDGDLAFPHLASAYNIAVSSGSHADFPALKAAREIIVWGSANFPALESAEKIIMWGRGIYWHLRDVDALIVVACGNPLFPALRTAGSMSGNGLGRVAFPAMAA